MNPELQWDLGKVSLQNNAALSDRKIVTITNNNEIDRRVYKTGKF